MSFIKLRLWISQIPLLGMTPFVVAALPITSMKSTELYKLSKTLLDGLMNVGLTVVSYASDGTETEQGVQRMMVTESVEDPITFSIHINSRPLLNINIPIPVHNAQLIAMIQDAKHALKTLRNNVFSGSMLLMTGNHAIHFQQIHSLAFQKNTPLYRQDVE
jgi:hypothetical protein